MSVYICINEYREVSCTDVKLLNTGITNSKDVVVARNESGMCSLLP